MKECEREGVKECEREGVKECESSSVVPAPVLDLTQPFQPSGSPDAPSSPTQSPTPVEPNVPVVDPSNEPSQDSDKAKSGTMIVVSCVALVLILMMTGTLVYRWLRHLTTSNPGTQALASWA